MSYYTNMAGQRYELRERAADPREDAPLRYCARCGGEIYYGADTLCDQCLEETGGRRGLLEYMEAYPDELLAFLRDRQDEDFLNGFFGAFYQRHELAFERWRRS